jgi:hypothetical protein
MKLAKHIKDGWEYRLDQKEADALRFLVDEFPLTPISPARISRADSSHDAIEREKLLNESLVEHRKELKRQARDLAGPEKFKASKKNLVFRINNAEREVLLQILNDIRIESWRILGEPENLEMDILKLSNQKLRYHHFMHLAGYFEHHFLNLDS